MSARGLGYAMASVVLVSGAQLALRWSVVLLPRPDSLAATLQGGAVHFVAVVVLVLGIFGYAASLLCWLGALARLPLGQAYSLLSLSYPLVYLCAALLPGLGERLSAGKTCGVVLILLGVLLINARPLPSVNSSGSLP